MRRISYMKKLIAVCCSAALTAGTLTNTPYIKAEDSAAADTEASVVELSLKGNGYDRYIQQYKEMEKPGVSVLIEGEAYKSATGMTVGEFKEGEGISGRAIATEETGSVTWQFKVSEEGLYNIGIRYYNVPGKNSDIERSLMIDGAIPFSEANSIFMQRIWKNAATEVERDARGNDIRPSQVEEPAWREIAVRDITGYYEEPYDFYFSKGLHTITLTSLREPAAIDWIQLFQADNSIDYKNQLNVYKENGYEEAKEAFIHAEGEAAARKSSSTLYPIMDRSPATVPYHVSKMRMNAIGGWNWRMPGQWIEWDVEVPESGLYQIAFKSKQSANRGLSSTRTLYIDGKIPFTEAKKLLFPYSDDWNMNVLGEQNGGDPYLFYLDKGKHSIRLEVTLGELSPVLRTVEASILELNALYRKIISFTGVVPDPYRDYQLEKRIPEMQDILRNQSNIISSLIHVMEGTDGKTGERTALLQSLAYQLNDMADRPETVPTRLERFKTNVGSLGTWMMQVKEQPLTVDSLYVTAPKAKLPRAGATMWQKIAHEVKSFFASFFEDYDSIGTVEGLEDNVVTVWVLAGRDQAQTIKRMIDNDFTAKTGVPVKLELVNSGVLLSATLAGVGPDVAIQVGNDVPVNFAMRSALQDLSSFHDFDEAAKRFHESAMAPYEYEGGYYALPEQQIFPVLFYRKDILKELNVDIPQTWDDVYNLIPVLQKNSLEFGMPQQTIDSAGTGVTDQLPPNPGYAMLLYQNDGVLYRDGGLASAIDTEPAIQAFRKWTELYANYKLPIQFDFINRFRTGEMPLGLADYTTYNTLTVSAPEIRGLWGFAPVPGEETADGTIRRDVSGRGFGTIMFKNAANKENAWEFMKWWTDAPQQVSFGREMEGLMGVAGRYPTANLEALEQLPWPADDLRTLNSQWDWVKGNPEVPGGYFTGRHLDNAFRRVVIQGDDARETIDLYVRYINEEITIKRKEFGLPLEK